MLQVPLCLDAPFEHFKGDGNSDDYYVLDESS